MRILRRQRTIRLPDVKPCRKVCFDTKGDAEAELAQLQAREHGEQRVHYCWQHQAWHLTSQALTAPPRERPE